MKIELFKIEFSTQHCFCRTDQNFKKLTPNNFRICVPQKAPMKCLKNLLYFWNKKITQIYIFFHHAQNQKLQGVLREELNGYFELFVIIINQIKEKFNFLYSHLIFWIIQVHL